MVKKFGLFCGIILAMCASVFTSCDKNEEIFEAPQVMNQGAEINSLAKEESVLKPTNGLRASHDNWDHYPKLKSTGNRTSYFSKGVYAVKISRSWYSGGTLTKKIKAALSPEATGQAYCSITKYSKDGDILEDTGYVELDGSNYYPIAEVSIQGDEYMVILFDVRVSGDYYIWF